MPGATARPVALPTTTIRVCQIPRTAIARELFDYFESVVGSVYACKISTVHQNWKSKGFGRVQFDAVPAAERALVLYSQHKLPPFQSASLVLSRSFDEIVVRPVDPANRLRNIVVHVGNLLEERWLEVLRSWDGARVDFMPERRRVDVWVAEKAGGKEMWYKMEVMFRDVVATFGCTLTGVNENAIVFNLKYSPRIYQRIYLPTSISRSNFNPYYVCKEDSSGSWVRTTDFCPSCSIGQSSYFCVEFPDGQYASELTAGLPFYEELEDLNITEGDLHFSSSRLEFGELVDLNTTGKDVYHSSSRLVPIIDCPPGYKLPYEIVFQLNTLVHAQKISYGQINDELFSVLCGLPIETAKRILLKMHKLDTTCYEPIKFIRFQLERIKENSKNLMSTTHVSMPSENLISCHRVLVTPTRVYLLGPETETSNHVVKHHISNASDFLRVSFVDEDWSKLSPDTISTRIEHGIFSEPYKTRIYNRILSVIRQGISIGGKNFEFLAFSASQLRSNSMWMFASSETISAKSIREWMGHFKKIRSVSKCAARMGQLFSSSLQTFDVYPHEIHTIPDIEVSTDGIKYCFSDGIGTISEPFARQLANCCGLKKIPSAYQIRYGGYKGVVSVDGSSSYKLSLRPSMLKFESNNIMLSVTKWSDYMPCYLNREIISLLSALGIEDDKFEALLAEQLQLMEQIFTNKVAGLQFLDSMTGSDAKTAAKLLIQGYEPSLEPYVFMILKAYFEYHLSDIRNKFRIFVPKGRVLIGCLDETGSLDYGQVYVRVTVTRNEIQQEQTFFEKTDETTMTVVGKIVVTKNPCLHPGDIRVLQAVRDAALEEKGLVDCLVFPQKGERPHSNECSGGDLDGDLYFACWDENLVTNRIDAPMDYIGRRPRIMDHEVTLEEIHNFFVDYMINDTLGAISTAHLVHADREADKARSPKCLQLANLHSMAVDFAKTGAPAEMPKVLKPKEYPDFMQRFDKPMYISTGVLGKLYRMATKHLDGSNPPSIYTRSMGDYYDPDLEVNAFESFLDTAIELKDQYAERFSALMNYYGAQSEDEILTGNLWSRPAYLERDRKQYGEVKDRILVGVSALQKEVMCWFKAHCDESGYPKLASACYHVTYHPSYSSNTNFLSFPWIFCDILLSIKSSKILSRNQ